MTHDCCLFGCCRFLAAAGGYDDWPVGRGIFHTQDKRFLVWVNEEDHLRLISMQSGGDLKEVYLRLVKVGHFGLEFLLFVSSVFNTICFWNFALVVLLYVLLFVVFISMVIKHFFIVSFIAFVGYLLCLCGVVIICILLFAPLVGMFFPYFSYYCMICFSNVVCGLAFQIVHIALVWPSFGSCVVGLFVKSSHHGVDDRPGL